MSLNSSTHCPNGDSIDDHVCQGPEKLNPVVSYVGPLVPVLCGRICGYGYEANRGQGEQDPDGPEENRCYYWPTCLESSQCYVSFRVNMTSSSLSRGSCMNEKTPYLITLAGQYVQVKEDQPTKSIHQTEEKYQEQYRWPEQGSCTNAFLCA